LVTFLIGVQEGIIAGVVLSIMALLYAISYPHAAEIALVKGTLNTFRNVDRYADIDINDELLIYRFDAALSFANIPHFIKKLKQFETNKKGLKYIVIDATAIDSIDTTSLDIIKEISVEYKLNHIRMIIACLKGPVRDKFERTNMFKEIGENNFFPSVSDAISDIKGEERKIDPQIVFQTNPLTNSDKKS